MDDLHSPSRIESHRQRDIKTYVIEGYIMSPFRFVMAIRNSNRRWTKRLSVDTLGKLDDLAVLMMWHFCHTITNKYKKKHLTYI